MDLALSGGATDDGLVDLEAFVIVLLSVGCLDFDRALSLLAIDNDLPLEDAGNMDSRP